MLKCRASAPSNIALIKYMGKTDHDSNKPSNASFSYTLNHLQTQVELEESDTDSWQPLELEAYEPILLSQSGQERFLNHLKLLKNYFKITHNFTVRSANNFPADCGLASSASSFAALSKCFFELAKQQQSPNSDISLQQLAELSRRGSGSSCRSFLSPWCEWNENGVELVETNYPQLIHQVIVVSSEKKQVSSSEAHTRVVTSDLFAGREHRANKRLGELKLALQSDNAGEWRKAFEICWAEFWDMHSLFETSSPSFGYMNNGSMSALNAVRSIWSQENDGPLVTMDAGPNVHLLYRQDQLELKDELKLQLSKQFKIFES